MYIAGMARSYNTEHHQGVEERAMPAKSSLRAPRNVNE